MAEDLIKTLGALDDSALTAKLGYSDKVQKFKDDLARADKLDGKAREKVNSSLKSMFTPNIYPDDLGWQIDRAEKAAAKPDANGPAEVVACCCDVPDEDMD